MRTLDLGSGPVPRGPEEAEKWGIELVDVGQPNVIQADLTFQGIPFPDSYFDRVYAYDLLEHLPKRAYLPTLVKDGTQGTLIQVTRNVHLELFNEIFRVLVPDGVFESSTPSGPFWSDVYRDPTHVSVWVEESWEYLVTNGTLFSLGQHYGLQSLFEMTFKEWRGAHMYIECVARKS